MIAALQDYQLPPAALRFGAFAGLVAFGALWGAAVALGGTAAVIVLITIIACIFCVRDFRAGVVLMILIMPISQSYVFPHEMFGITGANPLNLLMAATLGVMAMRTAGDGTLSHFAPKPLVWLYIVPMVVGAFLGASHVKEIPAEFRETDMIFFTDAVGYVRDMLVKPLTMVVYALLVAVAVQRSKKPERFITPLIVSVALMAAVVLVFTAMAGVSISQLAGTYARHFFSALGMHANDLGRLYAVAYALLLFVWDRAPTKTMKACAMVAMGVVVLALLLTFSRGAFLGFVLVNLIYVASRRNRKTLLLLMIAIPVGLYFMPGAVVDRVTMGWGENADTISAGRTDEIWGPVIPELWKSPVWGNGLGAVMWSAPMIAGMMPQVGHPHNAYLEVILDLGFVGLVVLMAFWILTWRDLRRLAKEERIAPELQGFFEGAAAGLLAFLVAGMAGSSLMPSPEHAFLWLAVGMMYGMQRRLNPREPAKRKKGT